MYSALTSKGLVAPAALRKEEFGTNLAKDKRYDQILHFPINDDSFMNKGGVLDFLPEEYRLFPRNEKR